MGERETREKGTQLNLCVNKVNGGVYQGWIWIYCIFCNFFSNKIFSVSCEQSKKLRIKRLNDICFQNILFWFFLFILWLKLNKIWLRLFYLHHPLITTRLKTVTLRTYFSLFYFHFHFLIEIFEVLKSTLHKICKILKI